MRFYSLKINDDVLFMNRSKKPAFVLRPLKSMPNFEVEKLSPQKLDHEMGCTDYPVD